MGSTKAYVMIDEHPDSINYGDFAVAMNDGVADARIYLLCSRQLPQRRWRIEFCRWPC